MPRHATETLVAYLDGELDGAERQHVEAWLAADQAAQEQLAALAQAGELAREAYAEVLDEPVPERLIAAAHGIPGADKTPAQDAEILELRPRTRTAPPPIRRWSIGLAAAAALFGIVVGSGGVYFGRNMLGSPESGQQQLAADASDHFLDNAAGYYKLTVSADNMLIDVPASNDNSAALQKISQSLPQQQFRLPDLKPWGLSFRGARLIVAEGRPAAELVYVTDNKAIGPLTLVIGATKLSDIAPTIDHREGVNLLYWRHHERAYALVGRADIGYLWGIANDIAWQLDAI
jgi:anti-sigma factor RsiW